MTDQHTGYPGAPPGWYPDPAGGSGQRWWDGYSWNEAVVTPTLPPVPPGPPGPWVAASARLASSTTVDLVRRELRMVNLAMLAVCIPALHYFTDFVVERVDNRQFHVIGDHFVVMYHQIQNNQPQTTFNQSVPLSWLMGLVVLATLGSVIVALVWQHRAASAARALGLPFTHSPGWGVGCWFVPVVNLFMPYQALRDCLPVGHGGRRLVLAWWLILMGTWTMALMAEIATYFWATPVGVVFGALSLLGATGLLATAPRMVTSIAAAHRALVEPMAPATPASA
jgi:hypothetical protein